MDNSLGFSISSRFLFEYPYKQLVIGNEDEIVAAQHKILALVQSISNGQALPLNWTVPRFYLVCDSSSYIYHLPTSFAALWSFLLTWTVFLHQEKAYAAVRPICGEACLPLHVESLYLLSDCVHDHLLSHLELLLQDGRPTVRGVRLQQMSERLHLFGHEECIIYLIYHPIEASQ